MPKKPAAPKFVEKLKDVEVSEGKAARIECVVSGEPEPDIDWTFEGQPIKEGGRFKFYFEKDDVVGVEVKNVSVDDEGFYECIATNKSGKATSKCELLVNAPGKIVNAPESADVKPGGTATFKCKYDGNPRPDVKWFKGSKQIKDADHYILTNKSQVATLEIDGVKDDDYGDYKVVVSNEYGDTEHAFSLKGGKKDDANGPSTSAKTAFQERNADRVYKPPVRKTKKKKFPIERDGILNENPEKYYDFGEEIGRGKFSVVKHCVHKKTGEEFAAKIIKFDDETVKFAVREYDLMASGKMDHRGLVQLHEAYLVRKYLILILELAAGQTLLTYMSKRHSLTEDDVAHIIRQMCEILADMHKNNLIHLDIRPTNIRMASIGSKEIKLVDFNSARMIANKFAGEVVDVIGDTEFCAPELLNFDPVLPGSDMWSVAVITYILLSGISPFYDEDEDKVVSAVQKVQWSFDEMSFERVTTEAKDFIKKCLLRVPEMRMTAAEALKHPWLSNTFARARKNSQINPTELKSTDKRLYSEEEEEYIWASLVFRTFDESEYESPESDEEDEEEE
ncbi:myosin light chain kinase, smooth muscle-like isoform X2 [Rhopilema esculentum]|uniref:myosin light chain kinase, smooth muscle-like isoform X2 n=1 Tax=Rhopilema esculentum TaxID=499914 RepID=UPI0031D24C3B|eukprot:gene13321-4167_t